MFKKAKKTDIDFEILGNQMANLKKRLLKEGVPPDAEEKMVGKVGLRGDSPAKNAQRTLQVPVKA